jgi:HEAT repeat protein
MRRAIRPFSIRAVLVALAAGAALAGAPLPRAEGSSADEAVAAAEKEFENADWSERIKVFDALDALKGNARAEKLSVKALKDDDWGIQIRAAKTLGKIGGSDAIGALAELAVFGDIQWVRDAACEALQALDPVKGTDALLDLAAKYTREDLLRKRAVEGAGRIAPQEAMKRLLPYTKVKEAAVAGAAVRALGRLAASEEGRKEVLPAVDDALGKRAEKKHFFAYAAACETVARIDAPEARAMVLREIREKPDDDGYVEERIARGLAKQDAPKVAESWRAALAQAKKPEEARRLARLAGRIVLLAVRTDLEGLLAHKDERVRSTSARALGQLADAASSAPLTKLLDEKSAFVRLEAVTALARVLPHAEFLALGERFAKEADPVVRLQFVVEVADLLKPEGIAPLKPLLADPDWRVQSAAAATVGTLGIAEDLPLLQPLTAHKDWKIRAAAYEGMGRLRAKEAIPLFADALGDKDPVVRGTCHANLQILTGEKLGLDAKEWKDLYAKRGAGMNFVKKSRQPKDPDAKKKDDRYAPITHEYALEVLQKARILVVEGAWDKVQIVLGHLSIPHQLMRAQELKEKGLNPNQIVLVNCEGNMDKDTQERVRWFVNVGGYLMTTDWALTKTVQPCFPGYVAQFAGSNTGNDVVVVEQAAEDASFTQGVFENVPALQWWLEIQAFPITVTWPERCRVLVDSSEMKQKYGSSPMAVEFRWGLGKVQHSLSHFFLQEEGMQKTNTPKARMIFSADNLGLSLQQIRKIRKEGGFDGQINQETMKQIAPDYSMFRLIVNVVREKSEWVENL